MERGLFESGKLFPRLARAQQGAARPIGRPGAGTRHATLRREPQRSATELAVEEMDHLVNEWFAQVLQAPPAGAEMLSTRGRLALLLADMPGQWQDQFLRPGRGRTNLSWRCATITCAPGRIFNWPK